MKEAVIVSAVRTPVGRYMSGLKDIPAYDLAAVVLNAALERAGLTMEQMELIEIQEAFAAQVLVDLKEMGVEEKDYDKVNVNSSGISLGYPIACTGTRVLTTLLHEIRRRKVRYGLETICGGGGLGIAAIFERKSI